MNGAVSLRGIVSVPMQAPLPSGLLQQMFLVIGASARGRESFAIEHHIGPELQQNTALSIFSYIYVLRLLHSSASSLRVSSLGRSWPPTQGRTLFGAALLLLHSAQLHTGNLSH